MLVPAAVLIVLLLGSIAVDFSLAFLAERELVSAASAAASDAATYGLDEDRLRRSGELRLDRRRVEDAVHQSLLARRSPLLDRAHLRVDLTATEVRVSLTARAEYLFAPAIPGAPDGAEVQATAAASPIER
jgi:Flp pilus assembly protein TadG